MKLSVFQQGDEATAEAEKIGGANHESLQKMIEIAAGAEFGRNLQQLVQFMRLALRGRTEFSVSQRNRAEAGDDRDQGFLLGGEGAVVDADR